MDVKHQHQHQHQIKNKPALVFGASGEQGRAVIEGFVDAGYSPVYGFTSSEQALQDQYLSDALQCVLLDGNLGDPENVRKALLSTKAQTIFVTTTTEMPATNVDGYKAFQDEEYDCLVNFFATLKSVNEQDGLPRTVILSTQDDVEAICHQQTQENNEDWWIEPLDDGSIVPHFSAKGKGAVKAKEMLEDVKDLKLAMVTTPFFYSNFLAFFAPLPNEGGTQWELVASFGHGSTKLDMMAISDLGRIVVNIAKNIDEYDGQNLRLAAEQISMDDIASEFSDLYGKDVIYNPLLPKELAALDFLTAPVQAQMCQFLGIKNKLSGLAPNIELTKSLLAPKTPTDFSSWLLTHSDASAFQRVGLDLDTPDLIKICVFGALSPQGRSVVNGLLNDTRKAYQIRCTTRRDLDCLEVNELTQLDPSRISFIYADYDDTISCQNALQGMDGAFLAADLHENHGIENVSVEEEKRHVRNIIDACEGNVKHLVFSTMEWSDKVNKQLPHRELLELTPTACTAAYARSKDLSVTFVLMPCYSETFIDMIDLHTDVDGQEKVILKLPTKEGRKMMCMSVEELGPAVATIFDSYQCFSGHEIGLVTDFVSVSEVNEIFREVFPDQSIEVEPVDIKHWVEAKDTYMKDLGQLFACPSDSKTISNRHSIAHTLKLVPSAKNLKRWVESNKDNPAFREKLGVR